MPYRYEPNATTPKADIFETPTPEPQDWYLNSAASWPEPVMTTTTVEQLERKARLQDKDRQNAPNRLSELPIEDMGSAADAEPRTMDFFNGKSYVQGRAAYNQHRISRGLAPVREGSR
jgi:hypothetical protein